MLPQSSLLAVAAAPALLLLCDAFVVEPRSHRPATAIHMGLFDGVKEAFSAPALERSTLDSERETPIDRWMGWSVVSENKDQKTPAAGTRDHHLGMKALQAVVPRYSLNLTHLGTQRLCTAQPTLSIPWMHRIMWR